MIVQYLPALNTVMVVGLGSTMTEEKVAGLKHWRRRGRA